MIKITLTPTTGNFGFLQARVDKITPPPINTDGGSGNWQGVGQVVQIDASGDANATFYCSVTGTKSDGITPLAHKTTHTLDSEGLYHEVL